MDESTGMRPPKAKKQFFSEGIPRNLNEATLLFYLTIIYGGNAALRYVQLFKIKFQRFMSKPRT